MHLLMLLLFQNAFISATGPFQLIRTMLKSLHVWLGLSPVWNHHRKGATKHSIIVYDEIKDRICKDLVSEYHLVYLANSNCLNSSITALYISMKRQNNIYWLVVKILTLETIFLVQFMSNGFKSYILTTSQ